MTLLEVLFDYVTANLSGQTVDENWQYGHLLEDKIWDGTASVLRNPVPIPRNQDDRAMRDLRIQVYSRAATFITAETEANRVFDFLFDIQGVSLSGWTLFEMEGSAPVPIGQDDKQRFEFTSNLTLTARKE